MILKSKPVFSPRPWGDSQLNKIYNVESDQPVGEVWLLSDFGSMRTPLEGDGRTFYPSELTTRFSGKELPRFPLLIKFISASQWLSVQVHPDDQMAKRVENEPWGKNECWYFLQKSSIALGLKESKSLPIERIDGNSLNYVDVSYSDMVFIPAGTIHAIGPGTKLIEIQQASDITYRIFDWGRSRELHLKKGSESIDFDASPIVQRKVTDFSNDFFRVSVTLKGEGTGLFVTLTEKPELYFLVNDTFRTDRYGLWITLGDYWKKTI